MLVWPQRRVRRYQGAGAADFASRSGCSVGAARPMAPQSTVIAPSCATNSRRVVIIGRKVRGGRGAVQRGRSSPSSALFACGLPGMVLLAHADAAGAIACGDCSGFVREEDAMAGVPAGEG